MFLFHGVHQKKISVPVLILTLLFSALAGAFFVKCVDANPMLLTITVDLESPQNTTYYENPIPIIFTYSARYSSQEEENRFPSVDSLPNYYYYQLDGGKEVAFFPNFYNGKYHAAIPSLSNGVHSLTVLVTAWEQGNLFHFKGESPKVALTVDNTLPWISVLVPGGQTYFSSEVPLSFMVDKPVSWLGYSLDGAEAVTVSANSTLTGLSEGSHTLTIYAGNMGSSETVTFTVAATYLTNLVAVAIVVLAAVVSFGLVAYFLRRKSKRRNQT